MSRNGCGSTWRGRQPSDQIVLVPTLWRDATRGLIGDSFPASIRITAGTELGEVLVRELTLPIDFRDRIAPFIIDCSRTTANWIRITATELSTRRFDGRYCLQFAEILVFDGNRNMALGRPVTASSTAASGTAWSRAYLTDGFLPYLMDSSLGQGSPAFLNLADLRETPAITIDLGEVTRIDELILHVVEQGDTVPQGYLGDLGVPLRFLLEGAETADFTDAVTLLDYRRDDVFDVAPIMSFRLPPTLCRFVRMTATRPHIMQGISDTGRPFTEPRFGFSEIEILGRGRNLSFQKPVAANFGANTPRRHASNLTDGQNLYGSILPIRVWLNELAMRYDLERELPLLTGELARRYQQQSKLLERLKWALAILIVLIILGIFYSRHGQQRVLFRARTRLAADLHDELGANLAAIALLSEMARQENTPPAQVADLVGRIQSLADISRQSVRYCVDVLHTPGLYDDLASEMRRFSGRMLADLQHRLELVGEENFSSLSQRQRIDLFLFYKECLINTLKHSGATSVAVRMSLSSRSGTLELEIWDDGSGLPGGERPQLPPSIARRARLLGARASATRPQAGGSCIRLSLRLRPGWLGSVIRIINPASFARTWQ